MGYRYRVVLEGDGGYPGERYKSPVRNGREKAAADYDEACDAHPGMMVWLQRARPGGEWENICSGMSSPDAPPLHAEGRREDLSRVIYNGPCDEGAS